MEFFTFIIPFQNIFFSLFYFSISFPLSFDLFFVMSFRVLLASFSMKAQWEVTLRVFSTDGKTMYKVTRRLPALLVSETKIFMSKNDAFKQFEEWL